MRATLTVTASEGHNGSCKVVLKVWDVPRAELRKIAAACDQSKGPLRSLSILDDAAGIVCNFKDCSVTLVKPANNLHGLQSRFETLLGKSLTYRLRNLQAAARRLAGGGDHTPQEDRLEGYPVADLVEQLHQATRNTAAASVPAGQQQGRKARRKDKRTGTVLATT
jgi:hypothetical protein